ncbi:type II secretion system F family protein [Haloglomus halophilum]|uniref:type II secretion system F family protein n=1 Tax=Haloglomus halophilum TaxID=2962672 RepID=UPI0020C9BFB1|nr:type II secretion system F family protein [Haloglomus halophilum]
MAVTTYIPLIVVVVTLAVLALAPFSRTLERDTKRLAYTAFGGRTVPDNEQRERTLRAAGIGTPYRVYVTQTYLYTAVAAFSGAVLGVYLGGFLVELLDLNTLTAPSPVISDVASSLPDFLLAFNAKLFALLVGTSLLMGTIAATIVYAIRWTIPSVRATTRERQIDASLPRMVAFIYAQSRGGMAFPDVMRSLSNNRGVFGAGAEEMAVGVRNIDVFGQDLVSAVRDLSRRTPSQQFQKFLENLTSVLQSGRNLSAFLADEYERYREQAEEQQEEILELLATTAEVYVTTVVAGMLFLITILLVIGLTSGDTLVLVQLITYVVLPATNLLFIAYLSEITQPLRASRDESDIERDELNALNQRLPREAGEGEQPTAPDGGSPVGHASSGTPDGGAPADYGWAESPRSKANRDRLRAYKRVKRVRSALTSPVESLFNQPELILFVSVPIAVGFVLAQLPGALEGGTFDARAFDDALIQAALFVMSTFAVVYEVAQQRLQRLESAIPDMLERLASLNEAGVAVVSSFDRVRRSDLGELNAEVDRIWRDIKWGATVEQALNRFERRVQTPSVTRTVTLLTNSMRASNEIGPVLRIASEQARADQRLKRKRKQEMFTYIIVIYVSFLVFLVVIGAIDRVLIPNLPTQDALTGGSSAVQSAPSFLQINSEKVDQYRLTFFHAGLIQAMLSGLVGGQMGGGSIKDGMKHASIMLLITYLVFVFLPQPDVGGATAGMLVPLLPF